MPENPQNEDTTNVNVITYDAECAQNESPNISHAGNIDERAKYLKEKICEQGETRIIPDKQHVHDL